MEIKDLAKRIHYIEIITTKKVDEALSGAYSSVFKGRGIEFSEVREYIPGDDVGSIDWNVTARYGRPFTKKFVEERQLNLVLAVDVSLSMYFSSKQPTKQMLLAEFCGAIGFSALRNNDQLSLFTFSDIVEKSIHPRRGRQHILRILREVLVGGQGRRGSDVKTIIRYLLEVMKKRAVIFLCSDFCCERNFWKELKMLNRRCDVICVVVRDSLEMSFPYKAGRLYLEDPETADNFLVNTNDKDLIDKINASLSRERDELINGFLRAGVDYLFITPETGWLKPLLLFFRKRERHK